MLDACMQSCCMFAVCKCRLCLIGTRPNTTSKQRNNIAAPASHQSKLFGALSSSSSRGKRHTECGMWHVK